MKDILVKDVMQKDVLKVEEKTLLSEALVRLVETQRSCVVVVLGPYPVGIVTERDVTRTYTEQLRTGVFETSMLIDDIMTELPVCVTEDVSFEDAFTLSRSRKLRHLPVVDSEDRLIGIVTLSDLLSAYADLIDRQIRLESNIEQLKLLTLEDALMGIGNRRAMEVDLNFTEAESRRHHRSYAVAL